MKKNPIVMTFVIEGHFEIDHCGVTDATECLSEAIQKLREMGTAKCKVRYPSDEQEFNP